MNGLSRHVFDAMGHGLVSSQLDHLAVSSYRHSRRSGLDLEATYEAMDAAVAARTRGEEFVTCILGRINRAVHIPPLLCPRAKSASSEPVP